MSHDLTVWVAEAGAVPAALTEAGFAEGGREWLLQGDGWAMTVTLRPVEDEDIPEDVSAQVAGIAHCIDMMLNAMEPERFAQFHRLARSLAETGRGAVEGLEAEPWVAGTALQRRKPRRAPPPPQRVAEFVMSWWFAPETLARPGMLEGLMATIARLLPEALPRRYESVEPPRRFKLAETGMDHFIAYLRNERVFALLDPTLPCLEASYPNGKDYGWRTWASGTSGYIPARLRFGFDSRILDTVEWRERLEEAWREVSRFLGPFYGDLRLLNGRALRGKRVEMFWDAEHHPATFAFWEGIPAESAFARVIGAPYLDLWPLPATDGLAFLGPIDWASRESDPTEVPVDLASFPQPKPPNQFSPIPRRPAKVIPFARPER